MQQGAAFSTVLYKNDITDWPTAFSYRGKWSALFCCRDRIEIKYPGTCSHGCCRMTSLVTKCCLKYKSHVRRVSFFISNKIYPPWRLFCNKHENACFISEIYSRECIFMVMYMYKLAFTFTYMWFYYGHIKHAVIHNYQLYKYACSTIIT